MFFYINLYILSAYFMVKLPFTFVKTAVKMATVKYQESALYVRISLVSKTYYGTGLIHVLKKF